MTNLRITYSEPFSQPTNHLVIGALKAKAEDSNSASSVHFLIPHTFKDALAALESLAKTLNFCPSEGVVLHLPAPSELNAKTLTLVGIDDLEPEQLRRASANATRYLQKYEDCTLALPTGDDSSLAAVCEGALNGAYVFDQYLSNKSTVLKTVEVLTGVSKKEGSAVFERIKITSHAVKVARDLVNSAPNLLYPEVFAEKAAKLAKEAGLAVKIYDETELAKLGCGAILGVGQGSSRPPRLVRLEWNGKRATRTHALIGKGITFDTGGISLKPAKGMEAMRSDMAGAAAVLGTMLAAAKLKLPVRAIGYLALAENMPGGNAQRPGDIITCHNGTTVEVINTDAEGRLVMADALSLACADKPDSMLDIATLTGAAILALGTRTAAVMGTEEVREAVIDAAQSSGESFWPLPLPEYLEETLKSKYADLANIGAREGGALTAGLFLRHFTNGIPWAHLDIAGPSYNEQSPWGQMPYGGTGFGVTTMLNYLEDNLS